MDATTFDGISRNLAAVSTRRSFARLLGGAAALGVGVAMAAQEEALGKNRGTGRGNDRDQVSAQGKGKGKKITICYQGQTKQVKKSKLGNFPGATRGACPGGNPGGGNPGGGGGEPQPVVCSRWIISGGPNQTDPIVVDDEILISNMSQGGALVLRDEWDGRASTLAPQPFDARIGDQLRIYAYDRGGCRSLSPLWLHCPATGQSRQLFGGYAGVNCTYPVGSFVEEFREVWV